MNTKLSETRYAKLGTEEVDFILKRNRRSRRMYFYIDDGGLRVSVPWSTPDSLIADELNKHSEWILQRMADWQKQQSPQIEWLDGTTLMYLGETITLKLQLSGISPLLTDRNLYLPIEGDQIATKASVEAWYRKQAQDWFQSRAEHYTQQLSTRFSKLKLSNAKTSWGNCGVDGVIRIMWRLIQAPRHLIDYVVAHEVSHLLQMNHSHKFWKTVEMIYPDYENARRELNTQYPKYLLV